MSDQPATGPRTLHVTWHEDAIRGAVERALGVTMSTDPDEPCTIAWIDLACLVDMGRAWISEQETADNEPADEQWCPHPLCYDRVHLDSVHSDERGRPFHINELGRPARGVPVDCTCDYATTPEDPPGADPFCPEHGAPEPHDPGTHGPEES